MLERLQELRQDDSAVSPVLGVALLIAITVTLVAVIGVVVLGVGPTNTGAPQANLVFENTSSGVELTNQGGDTLDGDQLNVTVENNSVGTNSTITAANGNVTGELSAGDSWIVATDANEGDVVEIVWSAPSSDESQVIASFEV